MGVKTLWSVLDEVKKEIAIDDLKGQTIAVDLSAWVCESIAAVHGHKPHLSNIFYRAVNLIRHDIKLVFVIEGRAPALKWQTIANRRSIQRKDGQPQQKRNTVQPHDRVYFNCLLAECCELLDTMGLPYIQSTGEAEAMCAALNREGLVDGVFTEDSDAFMYGALTVYRNLVASSKECSVDAYHMEDIEGILGLNRNKLIGMSLLIGCDYMPDGVPQVGKKKAFELMKMFGDVDVLERFRSWRKKDNEQISLGTEDSIDNDDISSGDEEMTRKQKVKRKKKVKPSLEDRIKSKAMLVVDFPNQKVIDEFLISKEIVPTEGFKWSIPNFIPMLELLRETVKWSYEKTLNKALTMVSALTMREIIAGRLSRQHVTIRPLKILKTCRKQWIQCFDVQWEVKECAIFYMSDEILQTTEPVEVFSKAYPRLTNSYYDHIAAIQAEKEAAKKSPKKSVKLSPKNLKMLELIRKAIRELHEVKGSTIKAIENHIISTENMEGNVKLAISRGFDLGLKNGSLRECGNGRYKMSKSVVMMEKLLVKKPSLCPSVGIGSEGQVRQDSGDSADIPNPVQENLGLSSGHELDNGTSFETARTSSCGFTAQGKQQNIGRNKQMMITNMFKKKKSSPQSSPDHK